MSDQPNILLLMTDQQRFDSLSCYGAEAIRTPHLDRLGEQGVRFEHCYVNNPICTPSRASLWTGQHLPSHGVYRLYDNLPEDQVLFSARLRELGYRTALFGKLHVSSRTCEAVRRHPNDGFDIYEYCLEPSIELDSPLNAYAAWLKAKSPPFLERLRREARELSPFPQAFHMTHWAAERTVAFLENAPPNQPFLACMSVFDPHNPYTDHPAEMVERVDTDGLADPVHPEDPFPDCPAVRRIRDQTPGPLQPGDPLERIRQARVGYLASVALIDEEVGWVLAALERNGLAENTLVIFVSDHGDMLGDHGLYTKNGYFYDPCTRVPMLMRWPARFERTGGVTALVQPHDVAATVLRAAGMEADRVAELMPHSADLVGLCTGEAERAHAYAFCLHRNSGLCTNWTDTFYFNPPIHATMVRDQRYKLNRYHALDGELGCGQLFDMEADPPETRNLYDEPALVGVRQRLTEALTDFLAREEAGRLGSRGGWSDPPWWPPK